MSAIALTTGKELRALSASLENRGDVVKTKKGNGWAVSLRGRNNEARAIESPKATFITSGSVQFPSNILEIFGRDIHLGFGALHGPGISIYISEGRLFIGRDGSGGRSLYYNFRKGIFSCASETKAFLKLKDFSPLLRNGALAQFLAYSFIPGPETMLQGVFSLPAGAYLEFELECPKAPIVKRWFFPELGEGLISEGEAIERFSSCMSRCVSLLDHQSDSPPALFLSGGLDSSCVAAELSKTHSESLHTYALHFGEKYPNELNFAREVVQYCGLKNHHEVLIQPKDFISRLELLVNALDEPIGDPVALPNFELAALVSQNHTDVFNGEGGDPLFGGPKNFHLLLHHWYGVPDHQRNPRHREKQYLASYRRAYEEISRLLTPEFRETFEDSAELEGPLTPFLSVEKPTSFLNKLMLINQRLKGAQLIQPKVERMLSAHGLRPLSPLFDEEMIKLSFQIPPTTKLYRGTDKVVMKRAFRGRLPDAILHRPKSGMRVPVHFWMQKEMKKVIREILSSSAIKSDGIFNYDRIQQLMKYQTEEGPGRYGLRLWMLMTFQLWKKQFNV